ncbi:hypothetical protein GGX14DRAFT_485231 [Mycena pura]|uniref:Uncharacterized protein n=1 Tax=Mycena pura TaxID=153505 RepID=A0AAD6XZ11_9AGAR|nr:hypothetical protein GGX14DRAFT_485231 [Mycena pura]
MTEARPCSRLPPELECKIFELAAVSRPTLIPALMRVAWRVKQWSLPFAPTHASCICFCFLRVEPLLYRTLIIGGDTIDGMPVCHMDAFTRVKQTKSPAFLGTAVRNVMLRNLDGNRVDDVLSACPGVENLYTWGILGERRGAACSAPSALDVPPLRRVHCHPRDVIDGSSSDLFTRSAFVYVTHLDILSDHSPSRDALLGKRLAALPHLTHLALNPYGRSRFAFCMQMLAACMRLRVLVVLCAHPWREEACRAGLADDVRCVMMQLFHDVADWQRGALTGTNYWSRAEALIEKRVSGEVDQSTFFLEDET